MIFELEIVFFASLPIAGLVIGDRFTNTRPGKKSGIINPPRHSPLTVMAIALILANAKISRNKAPSWLSTN